MPPPPPSPPLPPPSIFKTGSLNRSLARERPTGRASEKSFKLQGKRGKAPPPPLPAPPPVPPVRPRASVAAGETGFPFPFSCCGRRRRRTADRTTNANERTPTAARWRGGREGGTGTHAQTGRAGTGGPQYSRSSHLFLRSQSGPFASPIHPLLRLSNNRTHLSRRFVGRLVIPAPQLFSLFSGC